MKLSGHIALSPLLLLLTPVLGLFGALIAALSSFLIDLDHFHLMIVEKAFSYKKIKQLGEHIYDRQIEGKPNRAYVDVIYLFHTVEFNLLMLVFSQKIPWLKYIVYGFIFHIVCDIIHHSYHKLPIIRWLFLTDWVKYQLTKNNA